MSGRCASAETMGNLHAKTNWRRIFVIFFIAIYAILGWLRLHNALRLYAYLSSLGIWPGPLYLAISGGLVGLGFSAAGVLQITRVRWRAALARTVCAVFLVWLWTDRIWFSTPQRFLDMLPISIFISLVTILLMVILIRKDAIPTEEIEKDE